MRVVLVCLFLVGCTHTTTDYLHHRPQENLTPTEIAGMRYLEELRARSADEERVVIVVINKGN